MKQVHKLSGSDDVRTGDEIEIGDYLWPIGEVAGKIGIAGTHDFLSQSAIMQLFVNGCKYYRDTDMKSGQAKPPKHIPNASAEIIDTDNFTIRIRKAYNVV